VAERGMALILISHDLAVIAHNVQRMMVLYAGTVAESGNTAEVFARMAHPYTRALLAARPRIGAPRGAPLQTIPGRVPDMFTPPPGCRFASRCNFVQEDCRQAEPPSFEVPPVALDNHPAPEPAAPHLARCYHMQLTP
jgi:peptide/nickel transport system ATP-binding protein